METIIRETNKSEKKTLQKGDILYGAFTCTGYLAKLYRDRGEAERYCEEQTRIWDLEEGHEFYVEEVVIY